MECCIYDGDWWQCRDHVIPVSYASVKRDYRRGDTVKCCHECNGLLGNKAYHTIIERAKYLIRAYQTKARKYLDYPDWTNNELEQMGYNLRTYIQSKLEIKRLYQYKLQNLARVANGYDAEPLHFGLSDREIKLVDEEFHLTGRDTLCPVCKVVFTNNEYGSRRYCSTRCRTERTRQKYHQSKHNKPTVPPKSRVRYCIDCPSVITHYFASETRCGKCQEKQRSLKA